MSNFTTQKGHPTTLDRGTQRALALGLTARELDVLRLLADGFDSTHAAQELSISVHTCRGYIKNVLRKLGAHSQLQAVLIAAREGVLPEILLGSE